MTAADLLRAAIPRLHSAGIETPSRDARLLLAHAMGVAPDRLTLHLADPVSPEAQSRYQTDLQAREAHQPIAQITGQRRFWRHVFAVTPDVLDPRPDTETLVAAALEHPFTRLLDLGTGSGCILLSLLLDMDQAQGLGTDISQAALAVARRNAASLGVDRATFAQSDWCSAVSGLFDLIVANPPYIAATEMNTLAPEVRDWEPHLALTPGGDGLDAYRRIAEEAPAHLAPCGRLMVEIGPTQGPAVVALFQARGLTQIKTRPDIDGRDRVVTAQKPC